MECLIFDKDTQKDELVYGKKYNVFRGGKDLGIARYTKCPVHGNVFLKDVIFEGIKCSEVYVVDSWINV